MATACTSLETQKIAPRSRLTPSEMVKDFQLNTFQFATHRVTIAAGSLEEALIMACEVVHSGKRVTQAPNHQETPEVARAEAALDPNPAPAIEAVSKSERASEEAPQLPEEAADSPRFEAAPIAAGSGSDLNQPVALADTLRIKKIPPKKEARKSTAPVLVSGACDKVEFGAFEEEFFDSYEPPAKPLTREEMMELRDGPAAKYRPKNKKKRRQGFWGWLAAVFTS